MWSEATLLDAVVAHFGATQPIHLLRQVEVENRRIDGILAVGDKRVGIEAKTSRADFRNESDAKREPTERATNESVYLCPPGLIEEGDLPYGWGLWWAIGPASIRVVRQPSWRGSWLRSADALATSLLRRAAATERRVRVAERVSDPVGALVAAEEEVQRLEGLLAQHRAAVAREKARAQDAAEQVLALAGEQVCSTCESPIVYTRVGKWRHVDRSWDGMCEARRSELERRRRKALTGAEYVGVPAPRIVPAGVPTDC